MAKIIGLLSEKGGSGKTSVGHMLAHGLGSLPHAIEAILVITDQGDEVYPTSRRYLVVDGRNHAALPALLKKLDEVERRVVIIDGAAGQVMVDASISKVADLVVVPFMPSLSDVQRANKHLDRLQDAVGIPNRWPTHPGTKQHADRLLGKLPQGRLMSPIPMIPRLADLQDPEHYRRAATPLSRPSQRLAIETLSRLKVHPLDLYKKS